MGGVCSSGRVSKRSLVIEPSSLKNNNNNSGYSSNFIRTPTYDDDNNSKQENDTPSISYSPMDYHSGELGIPTNKRNQLNPSTTARSATYKVPQMGYLLGRAGIVGLEKAVEVLDTLGSSMSNLNPSSGGFISGMASRGNKISILAFEVANTIVKGANLLQSLSKENTQFLKEGVLHSDGVQLLVSTDVEELLRIAAADKREEFDVFSREVVRFGDKCKDPQWHFLNRYFQKLDTDIAPHKEHKEEAEMTIQELTTLAQHTAELYHELHALDRFEQDYRRKLEEVESLHLPRKGEGLMILHSELKQQRKLVRGLKKKSLWSKSLEEVMEKLVDVVTFIHQEIVEAFGKSNTLAGRATNQSAQRLGVSGLALHYANIINQIDNIVSRPTSLPPNMRDTLYHGLPSGVKASLLQITLTVPQIKAEMEKTLQWLVPVAANTTKAHQGFGWVGEWANTGNEFNKKTSGQYNLVRLQTLYHAEREKTDSYILELVIWLHHLISLVRQRDFGFKPMVPVRSPTHKILILPSQMQREPCPSLKSKTDRILQLSQVDQDMLQHVCSKKLNPGISKSQEFSTVKKKKRTKALGFRSSGSSPTRGFSATQDLERLNSNLLDVMDGLHTPR
ncbi:hypothetical protein IFM89_014505 [Coptis chinensis]|uniref:Uncharacterized protein n=1 Tax=Coptis chinensis TaxID=261450 RepID=A0A835IQD8_9MAGN|nr:hypothetical protein IFM89_014505 [Coptis chinensis]